MDKLAFTLIGAGIIFYGIQHFIFREVFEILREVEFHIRHRDNGDAPQLFGMIVNLDMIEGPRITPSFGRGDGFPSSQENLLGINLLRNNSDVKRLKRRKRTTQTTLAVNTLTNGHKRKKRFRNRSESRHRTRSRSPIIKRLTPGP